jgi:outer membrane receptor protein involved in Fe transport
LGRSLRPDRNSSEALLVGDNGFQWFNPQAFTVPSGEYDTVGRNSITGPGGLSVDMSLGKNFVIRDSMALNVRLNANNVFNRKNYTSVNTLYSAGSTVFGQVTGLSSPRAITIDARFRF